MKEFKNLPPKQKHPKNIQENYNKFDYWTRPDLMDDLRINLERADLVLKEFVYPDYRMKTHEKQLVQAVTIFIEDALLNNPTFVIHHIEGTGTLYEWTGVFDIEKHGLKDIWKKALKTYKGTAMQAKNLIEAKVVIGESFSSNQIWGYNCPHRGRFIPPENC